MLKCEPPLTDPVWILVICVNMTLKKLVCVVGNFENKLIGFLSNSFNIVDTVISWGRIWLSPRLEKIGWFKLMRASIVKGGAKPQPGPPEPPRYGGEQMKKSDNNYLSSNYKKTKMMVKVTAWFRQQSLMRKLFHNRRHPKDHPQVIVGFCRDHGGSGWFIVGIRARFPEHCPWLSVGRLWTGKMWFKT